jgi:hypothetical protein
VRGRPGLRIAATEIDERWPFLRRGGGDAPEQGDEVLLREPLEAFRTGAHLRDRMGRPAAQRMLTAAGRVSR